MRLADRSQTKREQFGAYDLERRRAETKIDMLAASLNADRLAYLVGVRAAEREPMPTGLPVLPGDSRRAGAFPWLLESNLIAVAYPGDTDIQHVLTPLGRAVLNRVAPLP